MRVLVAAASKHGATRGIAEAIGKGLRERGLEADVVRAEDVDGLDAYDAVVLGSGVYAGHWLEPAKRIVERHAADLPTRPTWLFSSGPIGEPPKPAEDKAVVVDELVEKAAARGHRVFAGALDKSKLGLGEKAIVLAFRTPEGDFRDWAAIDAWAEEIARTLRG
jgi:menaquinone-dependent protoporphyrinogen oxidase